MSYDDPRLPRKRVRHFLLKMARTLKENFWSDLSVSRLIFEAITLLTIAYGFWRLGFRR
jgi:hypothetical protein